MKTKSKQPTAQPLSPEPIVSAKECAEHFGVSLNHLRNLAQAGLVPYFPMSTGTRNFRRYRISDVERALKVEAVAS